MNFISNILKVTYNIHVILYFSAFKTGKKCFREIFDLNVVVFTSNPNVSTLKYRNGNEVTLLSRDTDGLSLCGRRANIVVTDISEEDDDFIKLVLPLVCTPSDPKFNNFIYNPIEDKIFCSKKPLTNFTNRV